MESSTRPSYLSGKHNLLFLLVLFGALQVQSFTFPEKQKDITVRVIDHIINNQYDTAFIAIRGFPAETADPLPALLKLAVVGMRDVDFEQIVDSSLFLSCYDTATSLLASWETKKGVTSYSRMLSGMCKAIHAAFYLRQKRYMNALQNGFSALDNLREAQELDSTNYEVDFFLGLYEYARAELRSRLWWVLFWYPGSREKGIERVRRCSERAILTGEAAKLSLCDMYVQEHRNSEASAAVKSLIKKYPASRFVLWSEVKYFEAEKDFNAAAATYGKLSSSYSIEKYGKYNALVTSYQQANSLYKAGKIETAGMLCDKMLKTVEITRYADLKKDTARLKERCNASKN